MGVILDVRLSDVQFGGHLLSKRSKRWKRRPTSRWTKQYMCVKQEVKQIRNC